MPERDAGSDQGCKELQRLYDDKNIIFEELASHGCTVNKKKKSTLYLVTIASTVGRDPCSYVQASNSECRLIAKNVPDKDKKMWDYYLMSCHYGPPCEFLENI